MKRPHNGFYCIDEVERTLGWLQKCRAILIRYDKNWQNYLGLIQLACGLLWYRRFHRLSVLR
jgi:putative transposase